MIIDSINIGSQDIFVIAILITCVFLCFEYERVKNQSPNVQFTKEDPIKSIKLLGYILIALVGLYILVYIMVFIKKGFKINSFAFDLITGVLMILLAFAFVYAFIIFWLTFADNYYNKELYPYLLFIGLGLVAVIYLVGNKIGYGIPIEDDISRENIKQGPSKRPNIAKNKTVKGSVMRPELSLNDSIRSLAPQNKS